MVGALPSYRFEKRARRAGAQRVAGVDEAGRGPLAGPVVAAAVVLNPKRIPDGIADSKALLPERRAVLFDAIVASAQVSIAVASAREIDRINIRQATLLAMRRAVAGLAASPCLALVDGNDCPDFACRGEAIVGGDSTCLSIAAASIVAKVARDRLMGRLGRCHPGYGFEAHKGYSTPEHLAALARLGPCPAHRRSFAPVAQLQLDLAQ